MKKILLPLEGANYRREILDFVDALNDRSKVLLTTALLPEIDYAQLMSAAGGVKATAGIAHEEEKDKIVAWHGTRIERYCQEHGVAYRIHEDKQDFAPGAIIKETRFADLMLLSSKYFFDTIDADQPNAYMKEVLHKSECPALLLPEKPYLPGEIILAYDGSASSVFAIRQFAYLFPEFAKLKATLVFLGKGEGDSIPEQDQMRELCAQHFRNFRMLRLHTRTESFYDTWIGMMNKPWLVAGAFGRSQLSELLHHNFVGQMFKTQQVPLFVAHR